MTTATRTTNRLHPCGLAVEYRNTARSIGSVLHLNREVRVSKPAVRWGAAGWGCATNDRSVDSIGSWGIRRNITTLSSSKRNFVAGHYLARSVERSSSNLARTAASEVEAPPWSISAFASAAKPLDALSNAAS